MPTTTGKIERFHRTMRIEFDTTRVFTNLKTAQGALDEWVAYYNTGRTHQSRGDATPASRLHPAVARPPAPERNGDQWVTRSVSRNGVVCVGWEQVSVGKNYSGSACNVLVTDHVLQFGWATSCSRRWPAPAQARFARSAPAGRRGGRNSTWECQVSTGTDSSSINRSPTSAPSLPCDHSAYGRSEQGSENLEAIGEPS
jgi:hypothetical protein